ncbi:tigger transposable element-derived protein 1-like [Stegodyphus dumicola]|uniref:tigger transposable element-derived protein 1-like n=1 Tax=Stegodyphus dumicola TaxID=202533 RepID=UPI0015A9E31D|nr:tigger transposable element-derived protein 1-like [Stegodyphus dumicola]
MADVARQYGLNRSTVCTILAKKDIIKKTRAAKGKLKEETQSSSSELEFKATTGWFVKFKRRSGIKHVLIHGETARAVKEAEKYCLKFEEFIETEGYRPQQKCDETGLFWKRMPNRTYITKHEKSVPGHKPMKDRLTLLLGVNASGDMKLKPLLVYHSENHRALKKFHNQEKTASNVEIQLHGSRRLFKKWLFEVCVPSIKDYLDTNDLPLKALLLSDNAPGHPKNIEDNFLTDFPCLTFQFLPPNKT